MFSALTQADPDIAAAIRRELERERNNLILVPSENYAPLEVLEAQGCLFSNKYAEGYPGARWYHGCQHADEVEALAIQRAKDLFGADHANVQPHAGTPANLAAYMAVVQPGDTILAMAIEQGGHLTHGSIANFSGRFYNFVSYGVDASTGLIDLDHVRSLARKHRPRLIVVGASAYPRTIDFKPWRDIANESCAYLMADIAHIAGLIAGGVHPDPVPYCDIVTSTTHKTLRGPRGAFILCKKEHARPIDSAVFPGCQGGPLVHVIAAKAVCFKLAMTPEFKDYARRIVANCRALAEALMSEGLRLVAGGTDNHLALIDLRPLNMDGRQAADVLHTVGIVANKNLIPFDPGKAGRPSGLRLGTPALTTRGMNEDEMRQIGSLIASLLHDPDDESLKQKARREVSSLTSRFPLYPEL